MKAGNEPMQQDPVTGFWVPAVPVPYDPRDGRGTVSWALVRFLRWLRILPVDPWDTITFKSPDRD